MHLASRAPSVKVSAPHMPSIGRPSGTRPAWYRRLPPSLQRVAAAERSRLVAAAARRAGARRRGAAAAGRAAERGRGAASRRWRSGSPTACAGALGVTPLRVRDRRPAAARSSRRAARPLPARRTAAAATASRSGCARPSAARWWPTGPSCARCSTSSAITSTTPTCVSATRCTRRDSTSENRASSRRWVRRMRGGSGDAPRALTRPTRGRASGPRNRVEAVRPHDRVCRHRPLQRQRRPGQVLGQARSGPEPAGDGEHLAHPRRAVGRGTRWRSGTGRPTS